MSIREIIESKIKAAGLTKRELAERAGIIPTNLNGMIANPSWPTLERLAKALDISIPELISEEPAEGDTPASFTCPHCGKPIKVKLEA